MSASNNLWEIAVAVPIKNPYFRYQNRFSATIDSIDATTITLSNLQTDSDTSISSAAEVMEAGDKITVKASSGVVSGRTLSSVPTDGFTVSYNGSSLTGTFAPGDTIVGYGNIVPGGWQAVGYIRTSGITVSRTTGAFDNFGMKIRGKAVNAKNYLDSPTYIGLRNYLDTDYYVQNLNYRFGLKYKYFVEDVGDYYYGWAYKMELKSNSSFEDYFIKLDTTTETESWTSVASNFKLSDSSVSSFYIYIFLRALVDTGYFQTDAYLDEVYLEHVYNPISERTIYGNTAANSGDDDNVGYYEIATWPEEGSVSWKEIDQESEVALANKGMEWYDATGYGERNAKYEITAKFTNVSSDIWDKLEALKRIQKNGYKLNLHPYIDELPSVLTGKMYIDGVDYTYWDMGYVSFNFKFRES